MKSIFKYAGLLFLALSINSCTSSESDEETAPEGGIGIEDADYVFVKGYYNDFGASSFHWKGNLIKLALFTDGLDYGLGPGNTVQLESIEPKGSGTYTVIHIYSPEAGEIPPGEYSFDSNLEIWTFDKYGFICTDCTTFDDSGISSNFEGGILTVEKKASNYTITVSLKTGEKETITGYFSGPLYSLDTLYSN